jgi:hypothetical protein
VLPAQDPLPDGVYVRLPDARYFGQHRLGSTDLTVLHKRPADWWYGSRYNPDASRTVTDEMQFGSALHAIVLEGEETYLERVAIKPATYPDAKTGEAKPWHGAAAYCKAWEADNAGKLQLTQVQDRAVRHMGALILNHPELGAVLRSGLPEIAVLYTDTATGLQFRIKIDYLLPRFSVDLKSFGGDAKGLNLTQQCLSLVAQRDMDVQRYLYFQGRQRMAELIALGALYGATPDEAEWLKRVAEIEAWQWCWIFYRRRDDSRGYAPVVKPIIRSHFDGTFETGRQKTEIAVQNFLTFRDRYGFDTPWAVIEAAEEPADHAFPAWMANTNTPHQFEEA